MLRKILIIVAVLIVVLVVVIQTRPADMRIARTATLPARPEAVFAQVNDLHAWDAWSPWAKVDPNVKNQFDGPAAGVGASMHWAGNNQVGEGNMTILESRPGEFIKMRLEFIQPFAASNTAEFTFKPDGNQTTVTWTMYGKNNFLGKAVSLVMDCDKMVGGQFETGLQQLGAAAAKKQVNP